MRLDFAGSDFLTLIDPTKPGSITNTYLLDQGYTTQEALDTLAASTRSATAALTKQPVSLTTSQQQALQTSIQIAQLQAAQNRPPAPPFLSMSNAAGLSKMLLFGSLGLLATAVILKNRKGKKGRR